MKGKVGLNLKLGLFLISILFLMMLVSFFYTPFDVNEMNVDQKFHKPSTTYLFGTDNFGRDEFSRIMQASQTAFFVGGLSVVIALFCGIVIGSVSGYFGRWVDEIIMRLIDALMAFQVFSWLLFS